MADVYKLTSPFSTNLTLTLTLTITLTITLTLTPTLSLALFPTLNLTLNEKPEMLSEQNKTQRGLGLLLKRKRSKFAANIVCFRRLSLKIHYSDSRQPTISACRTANFQNVYHFVTAKRKWLWLLNFVAERNPHLRRRWLQSSIAWRFHAVRFRFWSFSGRYYFVGSRWRKLKYLNRPQTKLVHALCLYQRGLMIPNKCSTFGEKKSI